MADRAIVKDNSEAARQALRDLNTQNGEGDIQTLHDELEANAYWRQCERECREEEEARRRLETVETRRDTVEHQVTEGLEVLGSIAAGALASWRTEDGRPIGGWLNGLVGIGSKAGSVINPESRPLRVAVRTGKVLLHSQISMLTRSLIEDDQ